MPLWERFLGFNPNRKREFPGQQEGEHAVYMGVFHWIKLVPFVFQVSLACLVLFGVNSFGFLDDFSAQMRFVINSTVLITLLHVFCFRLYNYFLKVMLITNYRLIDIRHTVFLKREREVIPLHNIQDIRYQQNGILARLLKYGDLIVLGSSSDVKYQFRHVPKANKMHHLLGEIHQKVLRDLPHQVHEETITKAAEELLEDEE